MQPRITDAELVTVAVKQALLGFTSERRWLRHTPVDLIEWFPHLPEQSGYNKLRHLGGTFQAVIAHLGQDTDLWVDGIWIADSTPVECGRSRDTAHRSDLVGFAEYGYGASHSRWFWGLRLHLLCTPAGMPVSFALTGAKADERTVLLGMLESMPTKIGVGQIILTDKNYLGWLTGNDHYRTLSRLSVGYSTTSKAAPDYVELGSPFSICLDVP